MITPHTTDTGADPLPGSMSEAAEGVATHSPALDMEASQSYRKQIAAAEAQGWADPWTDAHHAGDPGWTPPRRTPIADMSDETPYSDAGMSADEADAMLTVAAIAAIVPQVQADLVKYLLGRMRPV